MDAFEQSASVYALALTLAKSMSTEELTRTALLLTQLGTTLATLAGLQNLNQSSSSQELADLSGLRKSFFLKEKGPKASALRGSGRCGGLAA